MYRLCSRAGATTKRKRVAVAFVIVAVCGAFQIMMLYPNGADMGYTVVRGTGQMDTVDLLIKLQAKLRLSRHPEQCREVADLFTQFRNEFMISDKGRTNYSSVESGTNSIDDLNTSNKSYVLNGAKTKNKRGKNKKTVLNSSVVLPPCANQNETLGGRNRPVMTKLSLEDVRSLFPDIRLGGSYTPRWCAPKEKTAIIIPFRNRQAHLNILLLNLIPVLKRQKVDFTLFVIDQLPPGPFNRGLLHNVGYVEASKLGHYDCFIFHDVDLVPINDRNYYHCDVSPIHFISGINKFKYGLPYPDIFGGVVGFTAQQFQRINGLSNLYFGWGGEDDDLKQRVLQKGMQTSRKTKEIGLYDMIKHKRDGTNKKNPVRYNLVKLASRRQDLEGLNTLSYQLHGVHQLPLYTKVEVSVNLTAVLTAVPGFMESPVQKLLNTFGNKTTPERARTVQNETLTSKGNNASLINPQTTK